MADAPAPAPAVDDEAARAAKRQRLATTELKAWKPPAVTHTWTLEDLTVASFTDAALGIEWLGPEFVACGLRWRLFVQPKKLRAADNEVVLVLFLRLLDRTSAPVNLAEATLRIRGLGEHKLSKSFSLITDRAWFTNGCGGVWLQCFSLQVCQQIGGRSSRWADGLHRRFTRPQLCPGVCCFPFCPVPGKPNCCQPACPGR
jgi:hypothetical protein